MPDREITTHKVNGCNEALRVIATDQPAPTGANHRYQILGPERVYGNERTPGFATDLRFQNGPIAEAGVNGITHEALIAVVIDRLEGFQSGPFACLENKVALDSLRKAQEVLMSRTRERAARGVEGTHQV